MREFTQFMEIGANAPAQAKKVHFGAISGDKNDDEESEANPLPSFRMPPAMQNPNKKTRFDTIEDRIQELKLLVKQGTAKCTDNYNESIAHHNNYRDWMQTI